MNSLLEKLTRELWVMRSQLDRQALAAICAIVLAERVFVISDLEEYRGQLYEEIAKEIDR